MGVSFKPVEGTRGSYGTTDESGRFTLQYTNNRAGVPGGEHVVAVDYFPKDPEELASYQAGELELEGVLKTVMEKYDDEQTSPCRVTIDADTSDLEVKLD